MLDSSTRLLVVDDNDVKRYTITRTLTHAGFQVLEARSGEEALRRAADQPALIVLDVMMPDIDGYEVCRRLKANPATAGIPVLHLSGTFVNADSRVHGLESGADAYLTDVTEPPVLIATIRALLRMRQAESALRESEDRFRTLVEQVKDYAIFRTDVSGTVTTWNEGVRRVLGYEETEFLGMDSVRLFTPEDAAAGIPAKELAEASAAGSAGDDRWMVRRNGSRFWASGTTSRLCDTAGQVVGFTKVMGDRTDQKTAEDALREADRSKDEFLALLAHELRNPLAPLSTGLEILRASHLDTATQDEAREMMTRQLGHMVRLIDDLLDVGRITRGQIELRKERVLLDAVLDAAVETSRPLMDAGRHELVRERWPQPVALVADPVRLAQVVSNLLNNAAKYTPDGGRIVLSAEVAGEGGQAVIRVRDNGPGIAADMLPKVWGLFAQSDRTLGRTKGGLGIGLTVVKHMVGMHGGSVEARSEGIGMGSEFVIRLPTAGSAIPENIKPPNSEVETARPLRVLVVDDNVDAAESLSLLLTIWGHTVQTAHDGPTGLDVAGQFQPEVVVLDIGLPGMDGYEVARRLRQLPALARVRLIAQTGWGQDSDRERSRIAGFDAHLVKPVDPVRLQQMFVARSPV